MAKFAPGQSGNPAGRKKGVPNIITRTAKENIIATFDALGGVQGLTEWARENREKFYTAVWVKVLPLQLGDEDGGGLTIVIQKLGDK